VFLIKYCLYSLHYKSLKVFLITYLFVSKCYWWTVCNIKLHLLFVLLIMRINEWNQKCAMLIGRENVKWIGRMLQHRSLLHNVCARMLGSHRVFTVLYFSDFSVISWHITTTVLFLLPYYTLSLTLERELLLFTTLKIIFTLTLSLACLKTGRWWRREENVRDCSWWVSRWKARVMCMLNHCLEWDKWVLTNLTTIGSS